MGKESITLSMELAKTQCYEFKCFEDNYSLTISTQGCRIYTRKFKTKGLHSLYRALKYSTRQHKLDLSLSKIQQPPPIITNSHLNFRYLKVSANV